MVKDIKRRRLSDDVCKILDIFENSTTGHVSDETYELYYDGTINYLLRYNASSKRLFYDNWNIGALMYNGTMNFDKTDYLKK